MTSLKRRRGGGAELLAYRDGKTWHDVTAADINDYLHEISGGEFTAKDFRTWHATVLPARSARSPDTWATPLPSPAAPISIRT